MKAIDGEILPPEPQVVMRVTVKELIGRVPCPKVDELMRQVRAKDVTPK